MSGVLLTNVTNSVWHAFNALATSKDGLVSKSRLKVLTANIGTLLDFQDVEKGIDDFRSTPHLNFEHYLYYLHKELFSSLPETLTTSERKGYEDNIDEICWIVCKKNYLDRDNPVFSDESVFQLFRVFCFLSERVSEKKDVVKVVMSAEEVGIVASEFVASLGQEWDAEDFEGLASVIGAFKFPIFLAVMESKYAQNVEDGALKEAVHELYDTFVEDVLKKGILCKKGELIPKFREHWTVFRS